MLDPFTTGYLAGVATSFTARVLDHVGNRLRRAILDTPRQQAILRCYQVALAAWLPEDDPCRELYLPILEAFLQEPAVASELAKLVKGRQPDHDTLADLFAEVVEGRHTPGFDFSTRLATGVEAFLQVAEQEPELAAVMQTAQLRDATQDLRALATDVNAIRRTIEEGRASTGEVTGRDITTGNLVTGVQVNTVNHMVNIYRTGGGAWDDTDYRAALARYLAWLSEAMGRVVLRGIKRGGQQVVELPLHDVYVPLAAEMLPEAREVLKHNLSRTAGRAERDTDPDDAELLAGHASAERLTMQELLTYGSRLAVIGAPGCGKTTVLYHVAWSLAEALRTNRPELATEYLGLGGELPLPIYVPLGSYADHRRRFAEHHDPQQRQLSTFITHYLVERHAGLQLPDDFFASLLDQGRHAILLLDGLDEVPSEDERALVSQAVHDLTYGRPQARFVVTSRTQAYQGRVVLGRDFRVVRVLPLEPAQVADLIHQAYRAIYPAEVEHAERERQASSLIKEVSRLEAERSARLGNDEEHRLVTTPLLVRMLLIVHFSLRHLPDQRAELYMEVIETVLTSAYNPDEAVAQRLAQLGGDWRDRRDMLQHLAFHMHSLGQDAGRDIDDVELRRELTQYLVARRHKTLQVAEAAVADLVLVSRQRGGLLEERAGQYRFSHLSFQEFLTGRYLAEVERDIPRIVAFLEAQERVADVWWREPALLTGGYLHVTAPNTAADLVHRLAHVAEEQPPHTALALAAAELAATTFLEWGGAETTQQVLAHRIVALLTDPALSGATPALRAAAGRALARLGDPRDGVGRHGKIPQLVWCAVSGGPFLLGANTGEEAYDGETPQHELTLPTFHIARYPITNAQFALFIERGGYDERQWWTAAGWAWRNGAEPDLEWITDKRTQRIYTDWLARRPAENRSTPFYWHDEHLNHPNQPVTGVNWYEAMAYCTWLHRELAVHDRTSLVEAGGLHTLLASGNWQVRLPTEAEWEKAAGWDAAVGRKRVYAWGDTWDETRANVAEQIGAPSAVGVFPNGVSPCGALDMTGNVWEWTHSVYRDYRYQIDDGREGPDSQGFRSLRGGAWSDPARNARVSSRNRSRPVYFSVHAGFRVVVSPVVLHAAS